ncbi:hypothetical protein [Catellatospora sp. NPDC049609]|uniref:hypothetical protein n=1 Tax=Catellatospora sp. NPDC049609 TaxID=3155505 RepID=UPI00342206D7
MLRSDVAAAGVVLYCPDSLLERNTAYGVGEWLAGYLMIGQEGDREFFLRCDGGGPVFWADLGGLGEVDLEVVAPAFEVWLRSGFAVPPDRVRDAPLTADVYIDKVPVDGGGPADARKEAAGCGLAGRRSPEFARRPTVPGSEVSSSVRAAA